MPDNTNIRYGWLKIMYVCTIIFAGGFGIAILAAPDLLREIFGWPEQDPIVFGVAGSIYLSFACLSAFGLKSPLKFSPILLLQLVYKVAWLIGVIIPLLVTSSFPKYAILYVVVFILFVIGDLIAIPFSYIFNRELQE